MVYCENKVVVEWSVAGGGRVAALIDDRSIDDECKRLTSPFKEREEPSGCTSIIRVWKTIPKKDKKKYT
jgi:hypothetical protein